MWCGGNLSLSCLSLLVDLPFLRCASFFFYSFASSRLKVPLPTKPVIAAFAFGECVC